MSKGSGEKPDKQSKEKQAVTGEQPDANKKKVQENNAEGSGGDAKQEKVVVLNLKT